jgi:hypothetical protein
MALRIRRSDRDKTDMKRRCFPDPPAPASFLGRLTMAGIFTWDLVITTADRSDPQRANGDL